MLWKTQPDDELKNKGHDEEQVLIKDEIKDVMKNGIF